MSSFLEIFLSITEGWRGTFCQDRTYKRAVRQALAGLCSLGRRTLSRGIAFSGRDQLDWSSEYRLHSRSNWSLASLFRPIFSKSLELIDEEYVTVGFDDTKLKKTGKKVKSAFWQRDPMSPHYRINLIWGLRFLQASILLPLYRRTDAPPRALPIQFCEVPAVKKPKKNASEEEWDEYKEAKKKHNLSTVFVKNLRYIRNELDLLGMFTKKLLAVVDGSFCNKICMSADIHRTEIIGRTRKNAKLCFKARTGSRKYYEEQTFTPEEVLRDKSKEWKKISIYHGGQWRQVKYKEVKNVLWRSATKKRPLRLIVVAPTPYRISPNKHLYYRKPAFLLTTDLVASADFLVQKYFDRWQIEVNHREEKDTLGIGQAQVRSTKSVPRQPAFIVAAYAAMLLASVIAYNDNRNEEFIPLPKWRSRSKRPSALDLATQLRRDIVGNPHISEAFGIKNDLKTIIYGAAA